MPLNLSTIQPPKDLRHLTLDFGEDGTIEMTIDPNKFTIGRERTLRAAIATGNNAVVADMYAQIIESWDVLGADGEPIPLTPDGMDQLRYETLQAILVKMREALAAPKAETANA